MQFTLSLFFSALWLQRVHSFSVVVVKTPTIRTTRLLGKDDDDDDDNDDSRTPPSWGDEAKILAKPSYTDNFLLNFHNQAQDEKQGVTNSLRIWNDELAQEQASIAEWQDAFLLNGFSDFCPPMNVNMNCLMVGEGMSINPNKPKSNKLPWEDEAGADVTSLRVVISDENEEGSALTIDTQPMGPLDSGPSDLIVSGSNPSPVRSTLPVIRTELENDNDKSPSQTGLAKMTIQAAVYDCIIDQGLLESIVQVQKMNIGVDAKTRNEDLVNLVIEASTAIREHGIYVVVTSELSSETRQVLEEVGAIYGLEWEFELDLISNDQQIVSIGRRYNTGEMPKVGKLSRYYQT